MYSERTLYDAVSFSNGPNSSFFTFYVLYSNRGAYIQRYTHIHVCKSILLIVYVYTYIFL